MHEKNTKASEPKKKRVKGGHLRKMEIAADADKKINDVLTPDQQRQYALIKEKVKEKAIERKKNKAAHTMQTTPAQ